MRDIRRKQFGGIADNSRDIAGIVDDDIPLPVLKPVQAVITVALNRLEIGEQLVVGASAIEQGDRVPAPQCLANHVRPDEAGAAENQDVERSISSRLIARRYLWKTHRRSGRSENARLDEVTTIGLVHHN